jgi:hypothetical protein
MGGGGAGWGVLLLGAGHGLNPGMGWLFAVALGLQEQRARAVWRALGPLALGHALSVAATLGAAAALASLLPPGGLRWPTVLLLLGFGLHRLLVNRHPRYGGMRVGVRDLTIWSFLMASAHGAGLMVVPLMPAGGEHLLHAGLLQPSAAAAVLHAAGYLLVTGSIAVVVYHRLGLRLLRTAWINLDLLWGLALLLTAGTVAVAG